MSTLPLPENGRYVRVTLEGRVDVDEYFTILSGPDGRAIPLGRGTLHAAPLADAAVSWEYLTEWSPGDIVENINSGTVWVRETFSDEWLATPIQPFKLNDKNVDVYLDGGGLALIRKKRK